MRLLLAPALASLVLGLSACTTGYVRFDCPPGNPWPLSGWNCMGGYSEIQIAPNTYTVRFKGKGISNANAEDFTLLRAAELTLSKDRRYFLVLGASDDSTTRTTTTPSTYSPGQTI